MTELQQILLALTSRKSLIQPALCVVKRHLREDDTKWVVCNFLVIQICAVDDEWRRLERLGEVDQTVRHTLEVARPATDRMRSHFILRRLRNSLIAHTREWKGALTDVAALGAGGAFLPYAEQIVLSECANYAASVALIRHDAERRSALQQIDINDTADGRGAQTKDDIRREVAQVRAQVVALDPQLGFAFGPHPTFTEDDPFPAGT